MANSFDATAALHGAPINTLHGTLHGTLHRVRTAAYMLTLAASVAACSHFQSSGSESAERLTAFTNVPENSLLSARDVVTELDAPAGFRVTVFAEQLGAPRMMAVGPEGTVYVTRRDSGDVLALPIASTGEAGVPRKVVTNLPEVHGIALRGNTMYLATVKEIYTVEMGRDGQFGTPRAIVTDLPDGGQHPNRTIAIGPDSMLYVSVGSSCNRCNEPNPEHATMLRMKLDGTGRGVYASGLRNTVAWAWHPETGDLWGMDNGSDWAGNDTPPEELNWVQRAAHYGWPWCFGRREVDPYLGANPEGTTKQEFCPRTVAPVLTYQAHSAPIQMTFYRASQFPAEYRGDAFVTMRGSWNRSPATGYKVVRVRFANGQPTGVEDFLTGFLSSDRESFHGRVAGLAVARDGSLLVGDDTNGVIYRVSSVAVAGAPDPQLTPTPDLED